MRFTITFRKKTLKLSQQQSIIYILKEEDLIKPAYDGFRKVIFSDQSESQREPFEINFFNVSKLVKKYNTLKKIQESDEDIIELDQDSTIEDLEEDETTDENTTIEETTIQKTPSKPVKKDEPPQSNSGTPSQMSLF